MEEIKIYYDKLGNTLTVWFGNPNDEYIAEETGNELILMKDKNGKVIGFEKLNLSITKEIPVKLVLEVVA